MHRPRALLLLLPALAACAPPAMVYRPAPEAVASETGPLAVTRRDGTQVTVRNARVVGDTLIASSVGSAQGASDVRIPMNDVERITRDERGLNTLGLGVVGLVTGALLGGLFIIGLLAALAR